MDRHGDDDLTKKASFSGSRTINECLERERSKGLEVLHGKIDKNAKANAPKSVISNSSSFHGALKTSSAKPTTSQGKRSPVNKENICQNSKKSQSCFLVSKQPALAVRSPKKYELPKSPTQTSSAKPTTSQGKRSPVNKENICQNSKKSQSCFLVPKQPPLAVRSPKKYELPKSPTHHREYLQLPQTTTLSRTVGTIQTSNKNSKISLEANASGKSAQLLNLTKSNLSEYVPYRQREKIDISDLITNDSITLDSSPLPALRDTDVSFHPAEMTGRSTLHKLESKAQKSTVRSVDEILASSFVDNVREMRKSLVGFGSNVVGFNRLSTASSCISGLSAMQKNPRPTYIFENKSLNSNDYSITNKNNNTLGTSNYTFEANAPDVSLFNEEDFAPGEMMQSKFLNDEISWAKEHAVVPTEVLSEEALKKMSLNSDNFKTINQSSAWNSMSFNDTNFSMGNFFAIRSENIDDIIQEESLDNAREPIALISDDTITTTTTSPRKSSMNFEPVTPAIDNKNRSKAVGDTITLKTTKHNTLVAEPHDSKDSGNATGKSDFLSLSEIDRVLDNLQLVADDSGFRVVNEMVSKACKSKRSNYEVSTITTTTDVQHKPGAMEPGNTFDIEKRILSLEDMADISSENKENIDSHGGSAKSMADTLSFTESLLNTSIQNYRMSNAGQARSPLSPIPILISEPTSDNTENDADIDEFANSPIISPTRRKRFSKSPRSSTFGSTLGTDVMNGDMETNNEENTQKQITADGTPKPVVTNGKKSLCSTRLDGDQSSPAAPNVEITANSIIHSKNNRTLTPTHHANNRSSTNTFELSPLSSPCSYLSSAANSPSNNSRSLNSNRVINKSCHCSPQFDSTSNSEFRYLNAVPNASNGALRRVASSPSQSEASIPVGGKGNSTNTFQIGAPPVRTYSCNSIKSNGSTSARSISRCSNNSEFNHRDGKGIPIKATALELSWASVKLRTDSQKSMQVKNTSNKRLVVRIEIFGPGFQLISPESNMLTLQSQECRTIVVNFYPTVIGPAIGRLVFQPPKSLNNSKSATSNAQASVSVNNDIIIPLYAFGGNASITIQHLLRGPVGAPFLPMGEFCTLIRPLERSFEIYNKGPLLGFAAIYIDPIGLHIPEICNSFEVYPECTLIEPSTAVTIRIVFQPNHSELKKIRKIIHDVLTLAKLRIIYGDEAIRQRLRHIQRFMTSAARENIFTRSLDKLWTRFPGEQMMFSPGLFKDSASVAQDMWACISEQEVALTLNNNMLDETAAELSTIFTEADNTILFRTMCVSSPTNQLETVNELLEETHAGNAAGNICISSESTQDDCAVSTTSSMRDGESCFEKIVIPDYIKIDYVNQNELAINPSVLRVRNFSNTRQYFKVVCNHRNVFRFVPSDGYVQPNGIEFPIELHIHKDTAIQEIPHDIIITVYMENRKITIPVHVSFN